MARRRCPYGRRGYPPAGRIESGVGKILFLTLDFFQPAFRDWPGRFGFWAEISANETNPSLFRFNAGILDSVVEDSLPWPDRFYPGRKAIALFLLTYLALIGFFYWWLQKGRLGWKPRIGLTLSIALSALLFSLFWGIKMRKENTFLRQVSLLYEKEGGSSARAENYFTLFSPYQQLIEVDFDTGVSSATAVAIPSEKEWFFKNLLVFPDQGKIRWEPFSGSSAWSSRLFRLESILPFRLVTETTRSEETIRVEPTESELLSFAGFIPPIWRK